MHQVVDESKRLQRSIVYGSIAVPIKKPDSDHTHKWTVYVRGAHDEDISTYIKRVVFRLHESFPNPSRSVEKTPFEVSETGWGEFQLNIRIVFQDANQKPLNLTHHLKLYPTDDATSQVKTSRPVVSEHYEEIIFDPPSQIMFDILMKEPQYFSLEGSPRYAEFAKMEADELQRIEIAISLGRTQLAEMGEKSTTTVSKIVHSVTTPKTRNRK